MAVHPYFQDVEGHVESHILRGRQNIDLNVALTLASWRLHPRRPAPLQQSGTPDQSTRSRRSPRPGCDRYFAASVQNDHFSQLLLKYKLPNQSESYLEAPNKARVSPTSKPRACNPL